MEAFQDRETLSRALVFALGDDGAAPTGSDLCIRRRSGKRPFVLQIIPADLGQFGQFLLTPAASLRGAIVVITDPEKQARPPADLLRQMFGLTCTETAMALQLWAGRSVSEAADLMGIGEGTARWHLKNIRAKTDTQRQAELVSLISRVTSKLNPEAY